MSKTVLFLPDNVKVSVEEGENLLAAAANAGVYIHAFCGGDGVCGKCKVKIKEGEVASDQAKRLKKEEHDQGYRLACQASIMSDLVVEIPEEIKKDGKALKRKPKTTRSISARSLDSLIGEWSVSPPVEKRFLKLDSPTTDDNIADLQRVLRGIRKGCSDCKEPTYDHPALLKELPFTLRESNWEITAILLRGKRQREPDRIIAVEPGDTTDRLYGLALDIGTTNIAAALVNLSSGNILDRLSAMNRQRSCGEDIISRIIYSASPNT